MTTTPTPTWRPRQQSARQRLTKNLLHARLLIIIATLLPLTTTAQKQPWRNTSTSGLGAGIDNAGITALHASEHNGKIYAAIQRDTPATERPRLLTSADGAAWTNETPSGLTSSSAATITAIISKASTPNNFTWLATASSDNAPGDIYRSIDAGAFVKISGTGSGFPQGTSLNTSIETLFLYDNDGAGPNPTMLYAGTSNPANGGQLWRTEFDDSDYTTGDDSWEKVVDFATLTNDLGFDLIEDPSNTTISAITAWDGNLYIGTGNTLSGSQIYRSATGNKDTWTLISNTENGFGTGNATGGVECFGEFNGHLYAGTKNTSNGAGLWRTSNGTDWADTIAPGFGIAANESISSITPFAGGLWAAASNNASLGSQIYNSYDGEEFSITNHDGFANSNTKGGEPQLAAFNDALHWGGANTSTGAEIWKYTPPTSAWPFDEATGSTAGDPIGNSQGNIQGHALWRTDTSAPLARNGISLETNGNHITLPPDAPLTQLTKFTFSGWLCLRNADEGVIVDTLDENDGFRLEIDGGFLKLTTATQTGTGSTFLNPNIWVHFAIISTAANVTVYLNGQPETSVTGSPTVPASPAGAAFAGLAGGSGGFLDAIIDQFILYDYALTSDEILKQSGHHVPGIHSGIGDMLADNSMRDGDTIVVAPGSYTENLSLGAKRVCIIGSKGAEHTTIDAMGDGRPVTTSSGCTTKTKLIGFKLTGGDMSQGGGVHVSSNSGLTIDSCIIGGNKSTNYGGGLFVSSAATLELHNSIVVDNTADTGDGGGLATENTTGSPAIITMSDCEVSHNQVIATVTPVGQSSGGGIFVSNIGFVQIRNCYFTGNNALQSGGGIFSTSNSILEVSGSVIAGNTLSSAGSGFGGGLHCQGTATLTNNTIYGNDSDNGTGGGLAIQENGSSPVQNNVIRANQAATEPQVKHFDGGPAGWADFTHNAVQGGAAFGSNNITDDPSYLPLITSSWTHNPSFDSNRCITAFHDKARYAYPGCLTGKLIRLNQTKPELFLIVDNTRTTIEVHGDLTSFASANITYEIIDVRITNNTSPLVNAGTNTIPASWPNDLDGEQRISGGTIDIGADELHDQDNDEIPDYIEIKLGLEPNVFSSNGDSDGDGALDWYEFYHNSAILSERSEPAGTLHVATNGNNGNDGSPGSPFLTIQKALDVASDGDVIHLSPGTYSGVGNANLDTKGLAIMIRGEGGPEDVAIDGLGADRAFLFDDGETERFCLSGMTLKNGSGASGGAILITNSSSPTITNVVLENNVATGNGGAIAVLSGSPYISHCDFVGNNGTKGGAVTFDGASAGGKLFDCRFSHNTATGHGGAVQMDNLATVEILNCIVGPNNTGSVGGGIANDGATPEITHTTIVLNHANNRGGGLYNEGTTCTLRNSIIWANTATNGDPGIRIGSGAVTASDSVIEGGVPGGTNLSTSDPLFSDLANMDISLTSGSPARDLADGAFSPQYDIEGAARMGAPDAGAREYTEIFADSAYALNDSDGTFAKPFKSIKEALDHSQEGTIIALKEGIYNGPDNRDISFNGVNVTIRSLNGPDSVVIDCEVADRAFIFENEEKDTSRLIGLTLINGGGGAFDSGLVLASNYSEPHIIDCVLSTSFTSGDGGAIGINSRAAPTIEHTKIAGCFSGGNGGAIAVNCADVDIIGSTLAGNSANNGGAVYLIEGTARFENSVLAGNEAFDGGALYLDTMAGADIVHSTFFNNVATNSGGGIFAAADTDTIIRNTILSGNSGTDIANSGTATAGNSIITDGFDNGNNGNSDSDPKFISRPTGTLTTPAPSFNSLEGTTTFSNTGANFVPGELRDLVLNPLTSQNLAFPIIANTATEIVVAGDATSTGATTNSAYAILDYHIQVLPTLSPARNAGDPTEGLSDDIDRIARGDGAPDIGADEITQASVTQVNSPMPDDTYTTGDVDIEIQFDEIVHVVAGGSGPQITLETGTNDAVADYVSGSGTDKLLFRFTIAQGMVSADLDTVNGSLTANTSTIRNAAGLDADLATLPASGGPASLSQNRNLIIDAVAPTFSPVSIASSNLDSALAKEGDEITLLFSSDQTLSTLPTVFIAGVSALVTDLGGDNYDAKATLEASETEGIVGFSISGTDLDGYTTNANATTDASQVLYDRTAPNAPPTPTALSGPDINASEETAGVTVTVSLAGTGAVLNDTIELLIGGVPFGAPLTQILTAGDIGAGSVDFSVGTGQLGADGPKDLTADITDEAGNTGLESVTPLTLNLDTDPPAFSLISISSNNPDASLATIGDVLSVQFTVDEAVGVVGSATIAGAGPIAPVLDSGTTYTAQLTVTAGTPEGLVGLAISASDVAGNAIAASSVTDGSSVTVDRTAPGAPSVSVPATVNAAQKTAGVTATVDITGTGAVSGDKVELLLAATPFPTPIILTLTPVDIGANSIDLTIADGQLGTDGTKSITARTTDSTGNSSATSAAANLELDTGAPTLSNVSIASDNGDPSLASEGNVITLLFDSSEMIATPTVTIAGNPAGTITEVTTDSWSATYVMQNADPTGTINFTIAYGDVAGNPGVDVTATDDASAVEYDTATGAPTFSEPTSGTTHGSPIQIRYTLAEDPLPGSVQLIFTEVVARGVVTLGLIDSNGGTEVSFALDPANPVGAGEVFASDSATIDDGQWDITLSYQDAAGNPVASTVSNGVTIDTTTLAPTLTTPAANDNVPQQIAIDFTLPEPPLTGSVTLQFTKEDTAFVNTIVLTGITAGQTQFDLDASDPASSGLVDTNTETAIPDGPYTVRISYQDALGNTVADAASTSVTVDTAVPATPSQPDLDDADDSGASPTDNITNIATPTFSGSTEPFATIILESSIDGFLDGTNADVNGDWSITISGGVARAALSEGSHQITATAFDAAQNQSSPSSPLEITIDITAPAAPSFATGTFTTDTDHGILNNDGITSTLTPDAQGTAEPHTLVAVFSSIGDSLVGSVQLSASPGWVASLTLTEATQNLTATATDAAGNTSGVSTVREVVIDTTAPTISCPANRGSSNDPGQCGAIVGFTIPTANDNHAGATVTVTSSPTAGLTSGSFFPVGQTTVTLTAEDASGLQSTCQFTVEVFDDEIIWNDGNPDDITVSADAGQCGAEVFYTTPTAVGACGNALTVDLDEGLASGSLFPIGTTTVAYFVDAGETDLIEFSVTVTDDESPTISCPADIDVQCSGDEPAAYADFAAFQAAGGTANDACGINAASFNLLEEDTDGGGCPEVITRTYEISDVNGNKTTCTQEIVIEDTTGPTLNCPSDAIIDCLANLPAAATTFADFETAGGSASDNCTLDAGSLSHFGDIQDGNIITRTYEISDECGNTTTCDQLFTVTDSVLPSITCPANISVSNDPGECFATVIYTAPVGTDNCAGATTVLTQGLASGSQFPKGTTTVEYTVTDIAGNADSCSFDITVLDDEAPVITCPADITVSAQAGQCGATVSYAAPTATDNCDATITPTLNAGLASTAVFPVGTTTVDFLATDAAGNSDLCSFNVTVTDDEAPIITCPADMTVVVSIEDTNGHATIPLPTVSDNCDTTPDVFNDQMESPDASGSYPLGSTLVTFTTQDSAGNSAQCSMTVTVTTEDPAIIGDFVWNDYNANGIQDAGEPGIIGMPIILLDDQGAEADSTTTGSLGDWSFSAPPATYSVRFISSSTFMPTTQHAGGDATIDSDIDTGGNTAQFTVTAGETRDDLDAGFICDLQLGGTVYRNIDTDETFDHRVDLPLDTVPVELWHDTDGDGLLDTSTDSLSTTTNTNTGGNYLFQNLAPGNYLVLIPATAFGSTAPLYKHLPLASAGDPDDNDTAGDNNGSTNNAGIASPAVSLARGDEPTSEDGSDCTNLTVGFGFELDDVAPTFSCPTVGTSFQCPADAPPTYTTLAQFLDAGGIASDAGCGIDASSFRVVSEGGTGGCPGFIRTTIDYEITDNCGNIATCTMTYTVHDTIAPVISTCPPDQTIAPDAGCQATLPDYTGDLVATDNCTIDSITQSPAPGTLLGIGQHVITFTVTDACAANATTCPMTLTVAAPALTLSCDSDVNMTIPFGSTQGLVTITDPTTTGGCGSTTLTNSHSGASNPTGNFPIGTTVITWNISDSQDPAAAATCTQSITITEGAPTDADLQIATTPPTTAYVDSFFDITYEVSNLGPATADSATIQIQLPDTLAIDQITATGGLTPTTTSGTGTIDIELVALNLTSAQPITVTVRASGSAPGAISTAATVSSTTPDPDDGNNSEGAAFFLEVFIPDADLAGQILPPSLPSVDSFFDITYQIGIVSGDPVANAPALIRLPLGTQIDAVTLPAGASSTTTPGASAIEIEIQQLDLTSGPATIVVRAGTDQTGTFQTELELPELGLTDPILSNNFSQTDFVVLPGQPTALEFVQQPGTVAADSFFDVFIELRLLDQFGNLATESTLPVALSIGQDPNSGNTEINGVSAQIPVNGVVQFPVARLRHAGSGFTVLASATGIPDIESNPFDVLALGLALLTPPLNGTTPQFQQMLAPRGNFAPKIIGVGDFSGDRRDQILGENPLTHEVSMIDINADGSTIVTALAANFADIEIIGLGDFNNDDRCDILCRDRTSGASSLRIMNNTSVANTISLPSLDLGALEFIGAGRFDANDFDDFVVRDRTTGVQQVILWDGSALGATQFLPSSLDGLTISQIVDLDLDGRSDFLMYDSTPILWEARLGAPPTGTINVTTVNQLPIDDSQIAGSAVGGTWSPHLVIPNQYRVTITATPGIINSPQSPAFQLTPRADTGALVNFIRFAPSIEQVQIPMDPNDRIAGIGDFDGDGIPQLILETRTAMQRDIGAWAANLEGGPTSADSPVRTDALIGVGIPGMPQSRRIAPSLAVSRNGAGHAAYPFYLGETAVTIEQFISFLNSEKMNPQTDCFFDTSGNVFYGAASGVPLFEMDQNNNVTVPDPANEVIFNYNIAYTNANGFTYDDTYATFPMMGVTWYGALKYCNWLAEARGLAASEFAFSEGASPSNWHPAHLTAAEWADGFDDVERFSWLVLYPHAPRLPMDGNATTSGTYNEYHAAAAPNGEAYATPNGGNFWNSLDFFDNGPTPGFYYSPNQYGVFDLSGNAWEWQVDTETAGSSATQSVRGGSWFNYKEHTQTDFRFGIAPNRAFSDVSFRCASLTNCIIQAEIATDAAFSNIIEQSYSSTRDWSDLYSWSPALSQDTRYYWRYRWHSPGLSAAWSDWNLGGSFRTTDQSPTSQTITPATGWTMTSLAIDPAVSHYKHLFGMDSTVWIWDSIAQQYVRPFSLQAFDAFWLMAPDAATAGSGISINGYTPVSSVVTLRTGWNLIGPEHDNTPLPTNSAIRKILRYESNRFRDTTDMDRGNAYWIFSNSTILLNLDTVGDE